MGDPKELVVWQKAMDLVVLIYRLTSKFPKEEMYGLSSQMRRSSVSIPSNIAEGRRRVSDKEFVHFCRIAFGSSAELETQLIITQRLGYGAEAEIVNCQNLLDEVLRMLNKMSIFQDR